MKTRKNRIFGYLFFVVVATITMMASSCKKDESIVGPAGPNTYSTEEMKSLLGSEEYLPNTDSILMIWKENNFGGFKSEPIIGVRLGYPSNFFIPLPNGNYNQLVVYFIVVSCSDFSDSLFDTGRVKTEYNGQAQIVGKPQLLPGWENESDCVKVTFDCTNQNTEDILLTFTCTTIGGEISFTKKYQEVIYLPQIYIKLLAKMANSMLAETQEFHPGCTDHISINLIPNENIDYIIDYDLPSNVNGGDQIIFDVFGKTDTVYRQRLPINISQQTPMTIQFGLNFVPDQVNILIKHIDNETHVTTEEQLPPKRAELLDPNGNIYKIVDLIDIDGYVYLIDGKATEINSIRLQLIDLAHTPPSNIGELVFDLFLNYYIQLDVINSLMGSVVLNYSEKLTRRQKWELIFHLNNFAAKSMFCKMKFEEVVNGYQISMPENWLTNTMEKIMSIFNIVDQLKE